MEQETLLKNVLLSSFCTTHTHYCFVVIVLTIFFTVKNYAQAKPDWRLRHNDIIIKPIICGVILQYSGVLRCATRHSMT